MQKMRSSISVWAERRKDQRKKGRIYKEKKNKRDVVSASFSVFVILQPPVKCAVHFRKNQQGVKEERIF